MARTLVLSRASRIGEALSGGVAVPANATGFVTISIDMTTADLQAAGRGGELYLETTDDGGSSWRVLCGITWESGPTTWRGATLPPGISIPAVRIAGRMVRLRAPLNARYNVGMAVDIP